MSPLTRMGNKEKPALSQHSWRTHVYTHIWWADSWQVTLSIDPEHRRVHTHTHSLSQPPNGRSPWQELHQMPSMETGQTEMQSIASIPPDKQLNVVLLLQVMKKYSRGTRPSLVTISHKSDVGMPRKNCWAHKNETDGSFATPSLSAKCYLSKGHWSELQTLCNNFVWSKFTVHVPSLCGQFACTFSQERRRVQSDISVTLTSLQIYLSELWRHTRNSTGQHLLDCEHVNPA